MNIYEEKCKIIFLYTVFYDGVLRIWENHKSSFSSSFLLRAKASMDAICDSWSFFLPVGSGGEGWGLGFINKFRTSRFHWWFWSSVIASYQYWVEIFSVSVRLTAYNLEGSQSRLYALFLFNLCRLFQMQGVNSVRGTQTNIWAGMLKLLQKWWSSLSLAVTIIEIKEF